MEVIEEIDDIPVEDDELVQIHKPFKAKFISILNKELTPAKNSEVQKKKVGSQNIFFSFKKSNQKDLENNEKQPLSSSQEKKTNRACLTMINNNLLEGQGNIHYHNGTNFKGFYGNKNRVKGHFKFKNGFQYLGECYENSFTGEGTLIFPSGKVISGNWNNFQLVGKAKIEYSNGQAYFGEIKDFKKHGFGQFFFKDGSKYIGNFQGGLINGYGTYTIDDQVVCKGLWVNGQLQQPQLIKSSMSTRNEWPKIAKLSTVNEEKQSTHHLISSIRVEGEQ